mgnify:FL=1
MEPRRDDGDDPTHAHGAGLTGMVAAMEPRRDDGDDDLRRQRPPVAVRAAMEPRRDDGDDLVGTKPQLREHIPAAMEPRRDDGDDHDV